MLTTATAREFHPIADLFPLMTDDERRDLATDIGQNGLREPIWLYDGQIVDGRNRYLACQDAGVEPRYRDWDGQGSLVAFVVSLNVKRRHLSSSQKAVIALDVERALAAEIAANGDKGGRPSGPKPAEMFPPVAAPKPPIPKGEARAQAATLVGTNPHYVTDAKRLESEAPAILAQVRVGDLTIPEAKQAHQRQKREAKRAAEKAQPVPAIESLPALIDVADALHLPIDAESVDLIVTSPPYGLDKPYAGIGDDADGWHDFMQDWLAEALRVTKDGGRLALNVPLDTTDGGYRPCYAQAVSAACGVGWRYRFTLIWDEQNVSKSLGRGSVDSPGAPHCYAPVEMIAVFFKGETWKRASDVPPDIDHAEWLDWTGVGGIWRFNGESRPWEGHPAPFPETLPYRLVRLLSFPGDTVLDPFSGSGTTVVVAHRLGRQAIGFDQSAEYTAAARRRLLHALGGA